MNTDIHRLLDEAFAGVEMTPDTQDLKEEIRANLIARVEELEASGVSPTDAARRAIAELGDVRALLDDAPDATPVRVDYTALALRNHVRPRPAFVVRTVVLSLVAAVAVVLFVLGKSGFLDIASAGMLALGAVVALAIGFVTADALQQETTTNHPLPAGRAVGFGVGTGGTLAALALGGTFAAHLDQLWLIVVAALLLVASVALLAWLGATTTNRHKAWTRQAHGAEPPNRFEQEPETAARFGVYTVGIWVLTLAAAAALVFTAGWWWALVALAAGLAVWMFVLGRMLFGHTKN
jgi:hypothetical protein